MPEGIVEAVRRRESAAVAAEQAKRAAEAAEAERKRAEDEQRYRSTAQRVAMKVTERMTGRVVFPARWATSLRKNEKGFTVVDARERLEGKVEIVVTVNVAGGTVAQVQVGRPDAEEGPRWRRPNWAGHRDGPEPLPGPDWFERAIITAGIS